MDKTISPKNLNLGGALSKDNFLDNFPLFLKNESEELTLENGDLLFDWETPQGSLSILVDEKKGYYYFKGASKEKGNFYLDGFNFKMLAPFFSHLYPQEIL